MNKNLILQKAFDLIVSFENFKEFAYKDVAGVWTYGIGFTKTPSGKKVVSTDIISRKDADAFLMEIIKKDFTILQNIIHVSLSENKWIALISLVYNIGITRFRRSTLLSYINKNKIDNLIKDEFMRWVYSGGNVVRGLVNRRRKETSIYFMKENGNLF